MSRVDKAMAGGRLGVALGAAILRDAEVMRQLSQRSSLQPMALSCDVRTGVAPSRALGLVRAVGAHSVAAVIR